MMSVPAAIKTIQPSRIQSSAELCVKAISRLLQRRYDFLSSNPPVDTMAQERLWQQANDQPKTEQIMSDFGVDRKDARHIIIQTFNLSEAEMALLDCCVAMEVEPALRTSFETLQNYPCQTKISESLVKRLFDFLPDPIWRPTSNLNKWRLVRRVESLDGSPPQYFADPRVVDWYFGVASLSQLLSENCFIPKPQSVSPEWDIAAKAKLISKLIKSRNHAWVKITGPKHSGRIEYARQLCEAAGRGVICADPDAILKSDDFDQYMALQRFSVLTGRVIVWTRALRKIPPKLSCAPLQFILGMGDDSPDHCFDLNFTVPDLSIPERITLWDACMPNQNTPFPMTLMRQPYEKVCKAASLVRAGISMQQQSDMTGSIAQLKNIGRVERPNISWDDMVFSNDLEIQLKRFTFEASQFSDLMSNPEIYRLFGRDAAPSALFSGPPGVGKTMAAQCVAAELGMPLVVIDISRTVSKYIGETAKNLSAIFEKARETGALLFFDEADAYFSKRTELKDSHDRHANADTNHLLQLVEDYEGIVILATNKRANIDEAFHRRLRHIIQFHLPGAEERLGIWIKYATTLFGSDQSDDLSDVFNVFAADVDFTPAQIKSVLLNAAFEAKRANCAAREIDLKLGLLREFHKSGRRIPGWLQNSIKEATHV